MITPIMFVNILKNSIDELSDKVDKVISIEAGLENGQFVMINICDTGNGIQEKQLDDLFNLSKCKKEQGLGIGMWLTKNILENAGGDVYYADHTNGGARFEIRLPVFDE